jgi:hypothetical protein
MRLPVKTASSFLHHLAELERAVAQDVSKWDAEAAKAAQQRLERLAGIVRRIIYDLGGHH